MICPRRGYRADFFRLRDGRFGLGPVDLNLVARARSVGGFGRFAIDADVFLLDEPLQGTTRGGGKFFA